MKSLFLALFATASILLSAAEEPGSVVFLHPDGTGLGHWNAGRLLKVGPDGMLNWDGLERLAAYRPHQKNWLSSSSHAGATVHAYGKKVHFDSYGMDRDQPLTALSGKPMTLLQEAMSEGIRGAIINSGHVGEPGTGVFLASVLKRKDIEGIALQVLESDAELIFCGGEVYMLPEGVMGQHGEPGRRSDKRNLLEEAKQAGYRVIYTREELLGLPDDAGKVLGVFAARDTYNDKSEEILKERGLPTYNPGQPSVAEMLSVSLRLLSSDPAREFFIVCEEEGTDNFSNHGNARGMLDALLRADEAIGVVTNFMEAHPQRKLHLMVAADSDAGHPTAWTPRGWDETKPLPARTKTGAALDGVEGAESLPFMSGADQYGQRRPFGIAWGTRDDFPGSVVAKTHGYRSELLGSSIDNSDVYRILYQVLFGVEPGVSAEKGSEQSP